MPYFAEAVCEVQWFERNILASWELASILFEIHGNKATLVCVGKIQAAKEGHNVVAMLLWSKVLQSALQMVTASEIQTHLH